MPEINNVMAKEGRVFSTTLDIEIKLARKRTNENKVIDESGEIAEYIKALEVEDAET